MNSNERFNARLNSCQHPRAVHNALLTLAPVIKEARENFPERFTGMTDQEVINDIAATVRRHGGEADRV